MAKKPQQEAQAPEPQAQTGHNSGELTPAEKSALRMHHIRQLLGIADKLKPIMDERKKARALAKADGFKLSEIDAGIRLATMEDQSIFVDEIKELIEIAKAFNALPPGEQGDLFPDRRPVDERSFDEGKVAGLAGKDPEPPYGTDSEQGQAWMRGWHEGQRIMREDLLVAMEKRNAAKDELIKGADEDEDPDFAEAAE
jgi:ribosome modulation factor